MLIESPENRSDFRSMLQERYQGQLPTCKMHDLMRELALSIAEKEKFCAVYDGSEMIEEIGVRRLSINSNNWRRN